jgi:hypothetical protein
MLGQLISGMGDVAAIARHISRHVLEMPQWYDAITQNQLLVQTLQEAYE